MKVSHRVSRMALPAVAAASVFAASNAFAETLLDPLHAFCYGTSTCSDNGVVTPTTTNPPQFGFSISPSPHTGDLLVDVLIPNNDVVGTISISGTKGGASNTSTIPSTNAVSEGTWTSGDLTTFLGLALSNGAPPNPLDAWLPSTKAVDAGATGYKVYQADLGINRLNGNSTAATSGPLLNISTLPVGALVVGFSSDGTKTVCDVTVKGKCTQSHTVALWISTAQSGALFVDKPTGGGGGGQAPLPGALPLMGSVLGAGYLMSMWRRRRNPLAA